jgi:hypothetical protein
MGEVAAAFFTTHVPRLMELVPGILAMLVTPFTTSYQLKLMEML